MDINAALKAFVRTVERESITAAARDLGISQPAVTKHIRNLEARLNARLLERSPKNVRVTAQGAELYESCRHALASIDAALEGVRLNDGEVEGPLRVHAPVCIGEKHVHAIVMEFLDAHPQTNIELVLENRQVDLIHENFDIAIRFGRIEGQDVIARRIGWIQRILVAAPEFLDITPRIDAPEQLGEVALVATRNVLEKRNELQLVSDASEAMTVTVSPVLTTNSAQVLLKSLLSGRGVGTIQTNQVIDELRDGRLVRVLPHYTIKPIAASLTYPSTKFMRPVVRAFTDFAITRLRGITGISAEPNCGFDVPHAPGKPEAETVMSS
ncbi:LysR family transcriptional regulator [uncultured Martelella sp.]|uniref:LysR family transcriptional regulator n=1 Tax=uncultured Martelella sp. TaxID=392331 RepID=UPI0029C608AA|nr:LysR family transcriptional regulator [uncultured Martelella sp.]